VPVSFSLEELKEQLDNLNSLKSNLEAGLWQLKGDKSDLERKLDEIESFLGGISSSASG
jgi:predicted nuclease with TOPRIM domain